MPNTKNNARETRNITPLRQDLLTDLLSEISEDSIPVWPHPLEQQAIVKLLWNYLDDTGGALLEDLSIVLRILAHRMLMDHNDEDRQKTFAAYSSTEFLFQFFLQLHRYKLEPEVLE